MLLPALAGLTPSPVQAAARGQAPARTTGSGQFLPFTGTAVVTWKSIDLVPPPPADATTAIGLHREVVHFQVRDPAHYRVDVRVTAPALDAGTRTFVVNGSSLIVYDTRTGTAAIPESGDSYLTYFLANGLAFLMRGNDQRGYDPMVLPNQLPVPSQPLSAYLRALRSNPSPPVFPHTATVVGHSTLLGRKVDIVDYGPVLVDLHGCTHPSASACLQNATGSGDIRLWIDDVHPVILQARLEDMPDAAATPALPSDSLFRVTHISYGKSPSNADLHFQSPVPVIESKTLLMFSTGSGHNPPPPPRPYFVPAKPHSPSLASCYVAGWNDEGLPPGTSRVYFIWAKDPTGSCNVLRSGTPYLLVVERLQVRGLPSGLRVGRPRAERSCRVWSGTHAAGQQWAAFAKGSVSILVVTNALSPSDLISYVGTQLCQSGSQTL